MTSALRKWAAQWVVSFFDPRRLLSVAGLPRFFVEWLSYRRRSRERVAAVDLHPCLADRLAQTPFDPHYFFQGAWIARKLADNRPSSHVDIASSVLTVSVFSAFVPTTFVDYRPLLVSLDNLECRVGDVTRLPFGDGELPSLSCLHVIEHVGLGRYGDPLDPAGLDKAVAELGRVVAPGGRIYLTTPVGRRRVCFNAHRVSSAVDLAIKFADFRLASFALVDDTGRFHADAQPVDAERLEYGCGMFELVRSAARERTSGS